MSIKVGTKFRVCEGPAKGKWFTVTKVTAEKVEYKAVHSDRIYQYPRQGFEQYLERHNNYWKERNKAYKAKRERLKYE